MKKITTSKGIGFGADISRETKTYFDSGDKAKINRLSFRYVIAVILLIFLSSRLITFKITLFVMVQLMNVITSIIPYLIPVLI